VPNSGLIRYEMALNVERVLVTSPKGLAEVMTQKSYDFIKPPQIARSIGRILGIGVLFAEGDEHKVRFPSHARATLYRHISEAEEEPQPGFYLSEHQRTISCLLGQVARAGLGH